MQHKLINTLETASNLNTNWKSVILAELPASKIKLFRIDPNGLSPEIHENYPEALLVIEGHLDLRLGKDLVRMKTGDFQLIPKGTVHSIEPGGHGIMLLIDPE
ncbi:cupin domain-containing protein [Flexibacterium corallicola]|uniref:cupin domain-containing protein n=1 Tax=Flexibacterium corallicola TaxID=3037259 RepID=UPI00286EC0E5|nr:cupin domain-containing protein [Pseudovibrio sp. M1P-2-3]